MTDPKRTPQEPVPQEPAPHEPRRNDTALWVVVGLMALIAVGGLAYGLSYPSLTASNPLQTTGSAGEHARNGHPL